MKEASFIFLREAPGPVAFTGATGSGDREDVEWLSGGAS